MKRKFTLEEWELLDGARRAVSEKIGLMSRVPLEAQKLGRSRTKRTLLRRLYGSSGQA